jgi:hypothetical protein
VQLKVGHNFDAKFQRAWIFGNLFSKEVIAKNSRSQVQE